MSISKMSKEYQDELKRRIAARRLNKRQQRTADAHEHRMARIDGHEEFWIKAIVRRVRQTRQLQHYFGGISEVGMAELLSYDAQKRGRTFNEAIMHVAFNICGLGQLKEK